ncbi:hypothetical protein ACN4EG_11650 [Alkalinema pantanalense CENA528]|uniref:hypothetical protein n=1 Tax=Alkalinema pantanalense TaxID=1620705 RepID=UPI003D6F16D9
MFRRFVLFSLIILFGSITIGCDADLNQSSPQANQPANQSREVRSANSNGTSQPTLQNQRMLPDGQYPLQQATYNDVDGRYGVMVLNAPQGYSSALQLENVPMARLTDEQIKAGEKSFLKVENGQPALYLTEDFKIQYIHSVTEQQTNPNTGRTETVVVQRESNFWSPFAGSLAGNLAGQAIGNMLFRPQHYMPPQYQPGIAMTGYGGYGLSANDAVRSYRDRYQQDPVAVRNRTNFRSTGRISVPSNSASSPNRVSSPNRLSSPNRSLENRDRSTGSGYGSSNLEPSRQTAPRRSSSSFGSSNRSRSLGSGASRSRSSFGSRRSRR